MAGHSKWKNIQHRKNAQDAKRGQIFTRLIREITIAAKNGADPETNARLRSAVEKALDSNMSKDTIQKAIAKGSGTGDGFELIEISYEGYGPGGIAFYVECATDNKNRTVSEIRHLFTKSGGNLGTAGSVSYLFENRGILVIDHQGRFDDVMEILLDAPFVDIEEDEQHIIIYCAAEDFEELQKFTASHNLTIVSKELTKLCPSAITISDKELEQKVFSLYQKLDEHDDVQALFCNAQWSDELS